MRHGTATRLVLGATLLTIGLGQPSAAGAATFVQRCTGPAPTTQSGSTTITPGINARPTVQTMTATIHLFQCTPSTATKAAGNLRFSIKTPTAVTCALLTGTHTQKTTATVTWKNGSVTTTPITITGNGTTRIWSIAGKVSAGLFAGHTVAGQFHYKPVISPNGNAYKDACANTVAPGGAGRVKISGLLWFTTKPLTIT